MINKRLGVAIVIISVLIGVIIFTIISKLNTIGNDLGCFPDTPGCLRVKSFLDFSHIAVGILASLFALGIYLIFFSKGEEAILKRLEDDKNKSINEKVSVAKYTNAVISIPIKNIKSIDTKASANT